jgi:adenylyltransferase/sulfurtransferase
VKFSEKEKLRYSRQTILPDFGKEGQLLLKESKVLVVGAGGLGGPVLSYLVGAGVGKIGIVDFDTVELSNLHRQIHFTENQIGLNKAEAAKHNLELLNPDIEIIAYPMAIKSRNAELLVSEYDIVIDGSDNFPTRYLLNDVSYFQKKPLIYGAIHQWEGQVSVFNLIDENGNMGPNYRDLFPQPPAPDQIPNCAEGGVLGVLPGIIGSLQAVEAIKVLLQKPCLSGKLLIYDAMATSFTKLNIKPIPQNPISGEQSSITRLLDYELYCGTNLGDDLVHIDPMYLMDFVKEQTCQLIDVREEDEFIRDHVKAINIPLSEIATRLSEINPQGPTILLCQSGKRSAQAIELLQQHNFENLYNLRGGMNAIRSQKLTL